MMRIATRSVVARMANHHSVRDLLIVFRDPRQAMNEYKADILDANLSIPITIK